MIMNILKHILISAGPFAGLIESEFIVNFLLLVDSKIYELFDNLYGLYLSIASARIFDINTFDAIINNIYVFFGVVALFILAFNLLQAMINPDDLNKSTNSIKQFISRFVLAVFLTCITPALFDFLYDFQEAIMKFQVIPKAVLGDSGLDTTQTSVIGYQNENGKFLCTDGTIYDGIDNPCEIKTTEVEVDVGNAMLTVDGYGIAYHVFRGFMHPSGKNNDVQVDASPYFNAETGFWATWGGCAVGAIGTAAAAGITAIVSYFTAGSFTAIGGPLTAKTGAVAAAACVAAAGLGYTINSAGEAITAKKYLWSQAERAMLFAGDFSTVPAFDSAVVNGDMSYTPIVSTVAGLILVYLVFSFCLDLGVRAAKLIFYQLLAPVSFLISAIPSKKDLMSKWFKAVLTTWMEVFVRIFCMCGVALLIRELNLDGLSDLGLLAQGIIVLGLVTFAKQFPKLLSEVTGIKSGNMKLGIRDKLKEGGFFAAGAAVGGLIAGRGNPLAAYRAGKQGWKDGNFKGIGAEAKRRQDYKSALDSGATRRQMAWNSIRGAFGFDSTADAAERKIKTGATDVENNSANSIEYIDGKGVSHTILSGQNAKIDDVTAEELKAKKTQNIGAMTAANDKMRDLDKQIKWASSQKSWKSAMDDEADKKFNDGKYEHNIRYIDSSGVVHEEKVNGKRLSELSEQGMKFLYADESKDTFTAVYRDSSGAELVAKKKTQAELDELISRSGGTLVSKQVESVTEKKIRDEVRAVFSTDELSSDSPNLIKNKTEAFFTTLQNEGGFNYRSYVYDETGRQVYKDGKAVVETGGFTSKIDENNDRIITHTTVDSTGAEHTTTYKSIGNGMLEYIDGSGERKEMSVYDLSDMFDQKSKSTTGVLEAEKQAIAEGQEFIRARDENDAIDAILKQRDEKIAQALQSEKQRGREAAKKYTANRK